MSNVETPKSPADIVNETVTAERKPSVADVVIFTDTHGIDHRALVTVVFGPYCVNLMYVSSDPDKQDQYGRQTERASSVPYKSAHGTHGYYFRYLDEDKKAYVAPIES